MCTGHKLAGLAALSPVCLHLPVSTQVSDLEEERRKLRLEVKFRAKYHGKTALEMGLSPEQLLLLEEYVEGLKGGRNPEERLVTQLQQRVRGAGLHPAFHACLKPWASKAPCDHGLHVCLHFTSRVLSGCHCTWQECMPCTNH